MSTFILFKVRFQISTFPTWTFQKGMQIYSQHILNVVLYVGDDTQFENKHFFYFRVLK